MALVGAQFVNAVSPNPVGSLQAFAGADAPYGWLLCDGSQQLISTYPELYSVLGTTYGALTNGSGGSGSTHFRLPDLRGRMPIGAGNENETGNNTNRTLGTKGGDTRLQSHTHTGSGTTGNDSPDHTHNFGVTVGPDNLSGPHYAWFSPDQFGVNQNRGTGGANSRHTHPFSFTTADHNQSSGSGQNMPPFLVTNYIIKAVPDAPRSGLAYGSTPPIVTQLPTNPQFGEQATLVTSNGAHQSYQWNGSAWIQLGTSKPPMCIHSRASYTPAENVNAAIAFPTDASVDTDSMHSSVTNNTRFTANTAGVYNVSVTAQWGGLVNVVGVIYIARNGTEIAGNLSIANAYVTSKATTTALVQMSAGQYIEVYQRYDTTDNSTRTLSVQNFSMHWVGAA